MDGTAIVEALPSLELNPPRTSGGLDRRDIEDLADVVECLTVWAGALPDEERLSKLQQIDNMRALFHYRFDRSCDHGWSCFEEARSGLRLGRSKIPRKSPPLK